MLKETLMLENVQLLKIKVHFKNDECFVLDHPKRQEDFALMNQFVTALYKESLVHAWLIS